MDNIKLNYTLDLDDKSKWLTVTPGQIAKTSLLHVQEIGDFFAQKDYYTSRENLSSYLIKYTLEGEGVLHYMGDTHHVRTNDLFFIDCTEFQHYRTSPEEESWRMIWVHFMGPTLSAYYDVFKAQNNGNPVVTMPPGNDIAYKINSLISLYSKTATLASDVRASELLTSLAAEIIDATHMGQEHENIPSHIVQAREYLNNHYFERITLDELSVRFAVSKFHFQKQFKSYVGHTPGEYLLMVRLNRAKEQLRTTDTPVAQIAFDVGISNVSHFINLFKRYEGITPSKYRKNWFSN